MSTENMRKLMQLTEGLDDNRKNNYCPTCDGWGEYMPSQSSMGIDFDDIVPCPDCGPDDDYEPRLKTKDIKDRAFAMDESEDDAWEVEDFPVSESKGGNVRPVIRAVERVAEYYREESDYYDDEFSDSDDAEYFNLIVKLIKSKQPERAAYKLDNLDSIVQETMQGLLSDEEQIALHKFVTSYGHNGFEHWDDVYYGLQEAKDSPINEAPSRKDFRMVADLISKIEDPELRQSSAEDHAKMFALQNPRFNKELFMKACNVSDQEAPELFPGTKDALGKLSIREDDPDDTDWDAHWAREDGDDERADDLEADAEWARMDDELDDIDEATSKFRLAEIVGKDGLAELLSDLRTGGVDYLALYFNKLYNHFLDEYSDEIPVGSRTGRPEDPEEYVQDNLERYHRAEIEQYWNTPDMDESLDEARYDPVEEVDGPCRWWAMCDNDATTTEPHPILGDVPICDRCVAKLRKIEGLDESEQERPYICVHAKHGKHECHANSSYGAAKKAAIHWGMRNTAGIDAHLADVSHSTQFVGEEDDGDVPSRRVDDAELTGVLLVKIESALNFIAKGMEDASRNGSSGPLDTKQRVIILRRQLKEIKAYLESGKKLVSIFGKVKLANESANDLADLSYDFDQVQMDIHDAENLLYLHLNGRPVAIDEAGYGDEWCDDCGQGRDQCRCSDYEGSEDWDECPHCHELTCTDDMCGLSEDLDPDGMGYYEVHIRQGVGTDDYYDDEVSGPVPYPEAKKVALSHVKRISSECDLGAKVKKNHLKAQEGWSIKFNSHTLGEPSGAFVYIIPAEDADVEAWYGESVSLGSIVESILGEAQPRDYEMSDDELADEIEDGTSEFERDSIDPEIEDEELGLRFD